MQNMRDATCVELNRVEGGDYFTPGFFDNLGPNFYNGWNPYANGYYMIGEFNDAGSSVTYYPYYGGSYGYDYGYDYGYGY